MVKDERYQMTSEMDRLFIEMSIRLSAQEQELEKWQPGLLQKYWNMELDEMIDELVK